MALLGGRKKEEIIAVIDLGSASVGGMLIKKTAKSGQEIITSTRVPINFLMDVDFQAFWRCAVNSLNKVMSQLLKDYPKGPDKVLCAFSHLWVISQTRVIKVKKNEKFKIDKNFLDKIIENEIKTFKIQGQTQIASLKENVELVEYKIMRTSLNGYNVENPFDKWTKRFSAYVHMSLIDNSIKKTLQESFLKNFGDVTIEFRTMPFIIFSILKNLDKIDEGFLFLDIGGETSDISLVRRNVLEETISFPRGKNFLIRKVASAFKTFVDDAISILNSYQNNQISPAILEKLIPIIEFAKKEWNDYLEKTMQELSRELPLPKKILVVSNTSVFEEFVQGVKNESLAKFTILSKPFELERISAEALKDHFIFKRNINVDNDVFLMLESIFADKFL